MNATYSNPYYFASSPHSAPHDRSSASHSASTSASTGKRASSEQGASISSLGSSSGDEDAYSDQQESVPDVKEGGPNYASYFPPSSRIKLESEGGHYGRSARPRRKVKRPPRIEDLFIDLPPRPSSTIATPAHSSMPQKRRRVCAEPNCCQKGLREREDVAEEGADSKSRLQASHGEVSKTFQDLFWKRQTWLMEHRDADGESHCSEDSSGDTKGAITVDADAAGDGVREEGSKYVESSSKTSARRLSKRKMSSDHQDVQRTAGAGLPLARVKRVMKSADEEIKMISHESPSLLSRLCTVLIADVSVRAARNALSNGRRTVTCNDLRNVTVGRGEGAGDQWEFLRDCLGGEGAVD